MRCAHNSKPLQCSFVYIYVVEDNQGVLSDLDCVGHLVGALKTHLKQAKVVKNSCMALTSLVEQDGESQCLSLLSN